MNEYEITHKQQDFLPGCSSIGVDPIVSSHTRLCGHFTGYTKKTKKNQQTEGGRKNTEKHGF